VTTKETGVRQPPTANAGRRGLPTCAVVAGAVLAGALTGCSTTVHEPPVVRIEPAVAPSPARPLAPALPTSDELAAVLGIPGLTAPVVEGGADALLAGVGESDAAPAECVGPAYRLQRTVYAPAPVRGVATESWVGAPIGPQADAPTPEAPSLSGYFGVVRFDTPADAQAFFAAAADAWNRCNGQTVVLQQPGLGTQGVSRITDVTVDDTVVSAVVLRDGGTAMQRALGVAGDSVVDVELAGAQAGEPASGAVAVAELMLRKAG
jgi:hypothetical protein